MAKEKNTDQKVEFVPDFFQIPAVIMLDSGLQPLDSQVYGVVFWLERLKDGSCFASNATIARILNSSASGVANSLVRLRERGYIFCEYDRKGQRKNIRTLVYNTVNPYSNEEGGVTQMSNRKNNTKKKEYTSETLSHIDKLYTGYLINFKVDRHQWDYASEEDRLSMLEAAKRSYKLTPKRRDAVARRLADAGFEMCKKAIINIGKSSFHRGENDRGWYAHLDWIFASYERVEDWSGREN